VEITTKQDLTRRDLFRKRSATDSKRNKHKLWRIFVKSTRQVSGSMEVTNAQRLTKLCKSPKNEKKIEGIVNENVTFCVNDTANTHNFSTI